MDRFGLFALPFPMFDADDGASSGGAATSDANSGGQQEAGGEQAQTQPFAVFPDEKSFMARLKREAKAMLEAEAKALGFENAEAMRAALKAAREREEAEKSELDKLREAAQRAEAERQAALQAANERLIRAEVKAVAAELGIVDPDAAYALMDCSEVTVDESGQVQGVAEALKALTEAKPYLVKQQTASAPRSGADFRDGGAATGKTLSMNQLIRRAAGLE